MYEEGYNLYQQKPLLERARTALKEGRLWKNIGQHLELASHYVIVKLYHSTIDRYFTIGGKRYRYFISGRNAINGGRVVEIPFTSDFYQRNITGNVLEFGNVLSNYINFSHDVLDKYERGERIINKDVADFHSRKKYDLIISISTLEHVGFDEDIKDLAKVKKGFENLVAALAPNGKMLLMVPLHYNPAVDSLIESRLDDFSEKYFVYRPDGIGAYLNNWFEVDYKMALEYKLSMAFLVYTAGERR